MRRFKVGKLRLDEKCLNDNLGEGNFIFVGSSTDMWAEQVPDEWILRVLEHCRKFDNKYLFQSKNPKRFWKLFDYFPPDTILGTTIETNREHEFSKAPKIFERDYYMSHYLKKKMVSIEPIMDFDLMSLVRHIKRIKPQFVSIGADSQGHNLPEPSPEKVKMLIAELKKLTEVKIKDNLNRLVNV